MNTSSKGTETGRISSTQENKSNEPKVILMQMDTPHEMDGDKHMEADDCVANYSSTFNTEPDDIPLSECCTAPFAGEFTNRLGICSQCKEWAGAIQLDSPVTPESLLVFPEAPKPFKLGQARQATIDPNSQPFEVTITIITQARTQTEARENIRQQVPGAFEFDHVMRVDQRGRGELTFWQEMKQLGGKLLWQSKVITRDSKNATEPKYAWMYKRMTLAEWTQLRMMFESTEVGQTLLHEDVGEVWQVNERKEVWVKMFKTVRTV